MTATNALFVYSFLRSPFRQRQYMHQHLHTMDAAKSSSKVKLNPNDVLLGRGDWTVRYEGNVRFRDLIREKRALFGAATGRNARDKIAADVILLIAERGGRFLRRQAEEESKATAAEGVSPSDSSWIVVDKKVAMKKVKQAFRDKDSWTQVVPPSATAVAPLNTSLGGPFINDRRSLDTFQADHARDAMERTLRAYQSEAARCEAECTLDLDQQLRHAMALSLPGAASSSHLNTNSTMDAATEAIRIAARSAELDRLRQLASLSHIGGGVGEPNQLVQQTLLSMQQQQQNLQQLELNLRNSSLLPRLGGLPSSYGLVGGGGNDPFSLTQQLDVMQHLQRLQQQQQQQALLGEQQALLGGRGLTSLLSQNQYRSGLLDPSMLPESSSSLSSLQAAIRYQLDGNDTARFPLPRGAFHVPGSVPPLADRRHVASSNSLNDSIGAASERTTESRRSSPADQRKRRSTTSPSDSAKRKRPRSDIKPSSSSSA
jgi:hypothetical protein